MESFSAPTGEAQVFSALEMSVSPYTVLASVPGWRSEIPPGIKQALEPPRQRGKEHH